MTDTVSHEFMDAALETTRRLYRGYREDAVKAERKRCFNIVFDLFAPDQGGHVDRRATEALRRIREGA
jgi:hypothetical protein